MREKKIVKVQFFHYLHLNTFVKSQMVNSIAATNRYRVFKNTTSDHSLGKGKKKKCQKKITVATYIVCHHKWYHTLHQRCLKKLWVKNLFFLHIFKKLTLFSQIVSHARHANANEVFPVNFLCLVMCAESWLFGVSSN